jgi:hypothetical protein
MPDLIALTDKPHEWQLINQAFALWRQLYARNQTSDAPRLEKLQLRAWHRYQRRCVAVFNLNYRVPERGAIESPP